MIVAFPPARLARRTRMTTLKPRLRPRLGIELLEDRRLMSGSTYTVDALTDTGSGSGLTGDLR